MPKFAAANAGMSDHEAGKQESRYNPEEDTDTTQPGVQVAASEKGSVIA